MRDKYLPFAQLDIDETELSEIETVLRSGWITTGKKTREFEVKFASKGSLSSTTLFIIIVLQ